MISKMFRIKRRRAARTMVFERFLPQSFESFRRWPRKELIPVSFRFDFGQQPRTDGFLLGIRQLLRFFDRALQEFTHATIVLLPMR